MPVNTKIQIRRDTAANWELINPILDAGEMGYTTDTKILKIGDGVTAWNSLDINSQREALTSYSPRGSSGAYLSGSGLVIDSSALAYNCASIQHFTGRFVSLNTIEWRIDMALANWANGGVQYYFCKYSSGTATTQTWMHSITGDGTPRFYLSDGTSIISPFAGTSLVTAAGLTNGSRLRIRIVYVKNTGSGNYGITWYYSTDFSTPLKSLSTWTQLGTTQTGTSITYPYNVTTPITIGSLRLTDTPVAGTYYEALMFTDSAPIPVFDANFTTQPADTMMFYPESNIGIKGGALVTVGTEGGAFAVTADSTALSITGDMEVVMRIAWHDWTPQNATRYMFSKRLETGNQRSWMFELESLGNLAIRYSVDGINEIRQNTSVVPPFVDNTTYWIKATIDVDNGAGGHDVAFYYAEDSVNEPTVWTKLGVTRTTAGTITILDSTAPVQVNGWRGDPTGSSVSGRIYRAIIKNGIGGTIVYDANFANLADDTVTFTESSSNAATVNIYFGDNVPVYIHSTRYSFGVPDTQLMATSTTTFSANITYYNSFKVESPIVVDSAIFETTFATYVSVKSATRFAVYKANPNNQPTGNAVIGPFSVDTMGSYGSTYAKDFTPVTLQPGTYVIAFNTTSATVNYRIYRTLNSSLNFSLGASSIINAHLKSQTSIPTTAVPSDSNNTSTGSAYSVILFRWRAA